MTDDKVTVERLDPLTSGSNPLRIPGAERKHHVALITLRRPDKKNALNPALWQGLSDAVAGIAADLPRAVVITGAGAAFSAGMDINPANPQIANLVDATRSHDPEPMAALLRDLRTVLDSLVELPVPVIAAINGLAYGGGAELAIRCDLRVIDPEAHICFSEVRLGLMPDLGGGVALTRLVGPGRAADLILTARKLRAREALYLGVVNRVSEPGDVVAEALSMARAIAANGPRATRAALEVIRRTPDLAEPDALALEQRLAATLMASGECVHGISAFVARAEPEFPDPTEGDASR